MFIRDGKIVLDADMDAVGDRFIEVMVGADRADAARALKPLDERQVLGKSIFLFDGANSAALEQLGETRGPSSSDLFVHTKIRRQSCRERVCKSVWIPGVSVKLKT